MKPSDTRTLSIFADIAGAALFSREWKPLSTLLSLRAALISAATVGKSFQTHRSGTFAQNTSTPCTNSESAIRQRNSFALTTFANILSILIKGPLGNGRINSKLLACKTNRYLRKGQ